MQAGVDVGHLVVDVKVVEGGLEDEGDRLFDDALGGLRGGDEHLMHFAPGCVIADGDGGCSVGACCGDGSRVESAAFGDEGKTLGDGGGARGGGLGAESCDRKGRLAVKQHGCRGRADGCCGLRPGGRPGCCGKRGGDCHQQADCEQQAEPGRRTVARHGTPHWSFALTAAEAVRCIRQARRFAKGNRNREGR